MVMAEDARDASCNIEIDHLPFVNYALMHNDVPLIRRIRIEYEGEETLQNLQLNITFTPDFAKPLSLDLPLLKRSDRYEWTSIEIQLDPKLLSQIMEAETGDVNITLVSEDQHVIGVKDIRVNILPFNHWPGPLVLPEIIAAFVEPNHPVVIRLMEDTVEILKERNQSIGLSGYQNGGGERIRQVVSALYTAISRKNIAYACPPPSYDKDGQKIRTPEMIMRNLLSTCIDQTVLFAACMEALGLNPLIVFITGHAFPGVWLQNMYFPDKYRDDPTDLTKRLAEDQEVILLMESTLSMSGNDNATFDEACRASNEHLTDRGAFQCVVDIKACRMAGIRPLPLRDVSGETVIITIENPSPQASELKKDERDITDTRIPLDSASVRTRLDLWMRRLLDISGRNNLVNLRWTRSILQLRIHDLSEMEDALSQGKEYSIYPRMEEWGANSLRDRTLYQKRSGDDPIQKELTESFRQNLIHAEADLKQLNVSITQIYRAARNSIEENGANTLYLALGMLAWCENDNGENPHLAPIILIPMELRRHAMQPGYVLKQGEDEPMINITLLEMLRQNFDMDIPMDSLPQDEQGVDVRKTLNTFRNIVMKRPHWDVLEDAALGIFSFNKFMLWNDLHARVQDLQKNKIVSSLISNERNWSDSEDFPASETLDSIYRPDQLFCPMSADSSQLVAIAASTKGRSFILLGPPGTGKSQTITNIISVALAQGKKVLFVAEKMAALSVVQRRLESLGLGDFCLELHSNKSDKKEVLKKINKALSISEIKSPETWFAEANRIYNLRAELNQYVRLLHERHNVGLSVFDAIGRYEKVRHATPGVQFTADELERITDVTLRLYRELLEELCATGEACGHPYAHPLLGCKLTTCPPTMTDQVTKTLNELSETFSQLKSIYAQVSTLFCMNGNTPSYKEMETILNLCERIVSMPPITGKMFALPGWDKANVALEEWVRQGRERDALRSEVFRVYTEAALQLPVADLRRQLEQSSNAWFLPRWLINRQVAKKIYAVAKGHTRPPINLDNELERMESLQRAEQALQSVGDNARDLLGQLWRDGNPDWDELETIRVWNTEMRSFSAQIAGSSPERLNELRTRWAATLDSFQNEGGVDNPVGLTMKTYMECVNRFVSSWLSLKNLLQIHEDNIVSDIESPNCLQEIAVKIERWRNNIHLLAKWAAYNRARDKAEHEGLGNVIALYESNPERLKTDDLRDAFDRGFYLSWLQNTIAAEPTLCNFTREVFEGNISRFRELDENFLYLTSKMIYAKLAAQIPHGDGQNAAPASERGVLHRELQKQRRFMALRTLFQKIPNILPRLKPCLLMSPLSVAQYLDPAHTKFDLVIFDEASQVPTCEAVGAIARGTNAVIVGDQKQLPPTTFFQSRVGDDDDEEESLQDLESILDDCLALDMQKISLNWHYRSRHESLIAFSNHTYYANNLLTFPSPDDLTTRVSFRMISGVYDRSKSRTNRKEAEAIVEEIMRRLTNANLSKHTIGVVTLNQSQQRLIEDMLDEKRNTHHEIEPFFENAAEPLFVKNLENVQGDERDVILFSICYGPDQTGKVSMNFGPINQAGGGRRLNVAVSRARHEMTVFSSIRPDQIDPSRSTGGALGDLKAFLEYAQNGRTALYRRIDPNPNSQCESLFEEQVRTTLEHEGYTVHPQVGCSGYRIDLAIVHPHSPGRYVLGIECDGASYHSAKTARDRDKLRRKMLEELGWTLHRIWSMDWWADPKREVERVREAYSRAVAIPVESVSQPPSYASKPSTPPMQEANPHPILYGQEIKGNTSMNSKNSIPYPNLDYPMAGSPALFDEFRATSTISRQILAVVDKEGPISQSLLCKRVASMWGVNRVTSRITQRILAICTPLKLRGTREPDGGVFVWSESLPPNKLTKYRVAPAGKSLRDSRDIAREEIAIAVWVILAEQFSMPEYDLIRETAQRLGYNRIGGNVKQSMLRGIGYLREQNLLDTDEDGRIYLKNQ